MTEAEQNSTLMMERLGRDLRGDLAAWASERDQVWRVGARLAREGFRRPVAAKRSLSWVWFPATLATAVAAVALLLPSPKPLSFTVDGVSAVAGALSVSNVKQQRLAFSDGSEIFAAPGTRCAIADVTPRGARVDLLQGFVEASIQHRSDTSWSVSAGPFRVAVTGTRFSVRWDEPSGKLSVDLHEGSVVVTGSCIPERRLQTGQSLNVSCRSSLPVADVPPVASSVAAPMVPSATGEVVAILEPERQPLATPKKPQSAALEDRLRSELNALAEVRRELSRNPARALALADESRVKFPNGALREEREALAVFALEKLGRSGEVSRRAARFLAKFPDGPFSAKVRGILEHVAASPSR